MASARVLLVGLTRLYRELVEEALSELPDVEVVGTLDEEAELDEALAKGGAELVIAQTETRELSDALRRVLATEPELEILAVAGDGEETSAWRVERVDLGKLSPELLRKVVRDRSTR